MKLNRVLIIFKGMARAGGPRRSSMDAVHLKHHAEALEKIRKDLDGLRIPYRLIRREGLSGALAGDLIVTVGGDGTFLAAAHFAGDVPILCVNSMPEYSVGFFCAASIKNFRAMISGIADGRRKPVALPTIEARIDGRTMRHHAVNDILFMAKSPAEMAKYWLKIGARSEHQRSSGIWISTGAGSTAGILSAGGRKCPVDSRRLQYLVREPCAHRSKGCRLLRGTIGPRQSIAITPERDSAIHIDGAGISYPVRRGQGLSIALSRKTVKVFI